MGIAETGKTYLEGREKLAQMDIEIFDKPEEREEIMFWKGVNAALDLTKILDGKEAE